MMKPLCWPDAMEDMLWAKSADQGAGQKPESLAQHTWGVLQRLREFIALRPNLPHTLDVPRLWHILFWAAFLHDFGKAAEGFQARLRGGERWPYRHEVLSLAFVDWVIDDLTPNEITWLVAAIVSHHRDAAEIQERYVPPDEYEKDWLAEVVAQIKVSSITALYQWVQMCAAAWIEDLDMHTLAVTMPSLPMPTAAIATIQKQGTAHIRHWLKVYRRFVKALKKQPQSQQIIGAITLRGYLINADHSASAHAGKLPTVTFSAESILKSFKGTPYAHQNAALAIQGSALLTAPTGSGKTEAALLWVTQQAAQSSVPRMFYTLPYQASMNAMKLRLENTFPNKVGLQHGRGLLALYRMLLEDDDYTLASAARQAKWSRNLGRLNYPPIRVFSPYQMLKGMYRLKGYEALLTDYHNATFIFDEIHAYEVTRLALILKTMQYLKHSFYAHFFVMSATFPTLIKDWLREALDEPQEITATPELFAKFRRHKLNLLDGDLTDRHSLNQIMQDAQHGKSVLIVCNTVNRAQMVYEYLHPRLKITGIQTELLHGRFNIQDRSAKERLVREASGSTSKQRRPIVLVATQVVEVSLDIDIDTLYTDPAPLEALVQRFGRINRRRKQNELAPVHIYRHPDNGQGIYDELLVQRTLEILERENQCPLDEAAVGHWLDEIYSGEVENKWRHEYQRVAEEFEASCIQTLQPFAADKELEMLFYKAFDGLDVLPQGLVEVYQQTRQTNPIFSGELLVSISWRRFHVLKNKGLAVPREKDMPPVVMADYNSEMGLMFDREG